MIEEAHIPIIMLGMLSLERYMCCSTQSRKPKLRISKKDEAKYFVDHEMAGSPAKAGECRFRV